LENQNNKIDYDKEYKGWEILKLIDEDTLKEGDVIEFNDNDKYKTKMYITPTKALRFSGSNNEVKNSYLSSTIPYYFKIIKPQKPLTFQEVLNEKYNGKNFRVEHELISKLGVESYSINEYYILNYILYIIDKNFNDIEIRQILNEAKFYVEE
jgi:hypothetical protein